MPRIPKTAVVDIASPPALPQHNLPAVLDAEAAVRHRALLLAATADNTRRTYRSAIAHYLSRGGALPATEHHLIRYLLDHAGILNPRTLALRLTALSQWHKHQGFMDPAASPTVRKTLVGIERTHGTPKKKARALPVEDLEKIVAHLATLDTLTALRDSALLQLGFFGGFRRSELVAIDVGHIAWLPEGIAITLQRSKTDQRGEGMVRAIPLGEGICCPATALRRWLEAADIGSGPLFRSINQWGALGTGALHAGSVNTILAACAQHAGLGYVPELSSHSLRRGMATSAHRAGADFRGIKRQGGWRHDPTVQGYIEEAGQFEDNAAGSLLKRR